MLARLFGLLTYTTFLFLSRGHSSDIVIPPTEYLPAYPGSWWKYVDDKGDTALSWVDSAYRYDSPETDTRCPEYGKPAFVPVLHSDVVSGPVYGQTTYLGSTTASCGFIPFLDTLAGRSWYYVSESRPCADPNHPKDWPCPFRTVLSTDTSLAVNGKAYDSLLLIKAVTLIDTNYWYFRKGIGMIYGIRTDSSGAVTRIRSLAAFAINRLATRPQAIVIDSLVGETSRIPMSYWGGFVGEASSDYHATRMMRNPDFDTLKLVSHASSDLPTSVSIDSGEGDVLDGARLRVAGKVQIVRIRVSQVGNASYYPAPDFLGSLCVFPKPRVKVAYTSEGATLTTDAPGELSWNLCLQGNYCDSLVSKGSNQLNVTASGIYQLIAKYHFGYGSCDGTGTPSDSIHVELGPASGGRPSSPDGSGSVSIRLFGYLVPGRLRLASGLETSVRIRGINGEVVPYFKTRVRNGGLEADWSGSPRPGVYGYRICNARSECLSGILALP